MNVVEWFMFWISWQGLRQILSGILEFFSMNRVWIRSRVDRRPSRVALVCIAKDEDAYIREWIAYHLKLGVDHVFVYQNDWRANSSLASDSVHLIEYDGGQRQMSAYNDFINRHSKEFDFGIFIDVDEYICLQKEADIKSFLSRYAGYPAVGLNWRLFGDNGLSDVVGGDYSLVNRFTMCGRQLDRHIKSIVNFNVLPAGARFINPHFVYHPFVLNLTVTPDCKFYIYGPWNRHYSCGVAWINHYWTKTKGEFYRNKSKRGRSDVPRDSPDQYYRIDMFNKYNINEVEDLTAKRFYSS